MIVSLALDEEKATKQSTKHPKVSIRKYKSTNCTTMVLELVCTQRKESHLHLIQETILWQQNVSLNNPTCSQQENQNKKKNKLQPIN